MTPASAIHPIRPRRNRRHYFLPVDHLGATETPLPPDKAARQGRNPKGLDFGYSAG